MKLKRFFELANQQWPVDSGPIIMGRHNITVGADGQLIVAIYLVDIAKWQTFYVTDDEFDDPESLVKGMVNLLKLLKQKAEHAN